MHRLDRGAAGAGATEREMMALLISMSNAMSTAVRLLAEQVDALRAVVDGGRR
jgi:isoaspartyl peptidase/L-asparaginase-like protein (Ntn-hydrolase superfamily)